MTTTEGMRTPVNGPICVGCSSGTHSHANSAAEPSVIGSRTWATVELVVPRSMPMTRVPGLAVAAAVRNFSRRFINYGICGGVARVPLDIYGGNVKTEKKLLSTSNAC